MAKVRVTKAVQEWAARMQANGQEVRETTNGHLYAVLRNVPVQRKPTKQ